MATNVDYREIEAMAEAERQQEEDDSRLYSMDAELSLLGAMIIRPECVSMLNLKPEDFFSEKLGKLYSAIKEIDAEKHDVDVTSIGEKMKLTGEAKIWIYEMVSKTPFGGNWKTYADIVADKSKRRNIVNLSYEMMRIAQSDGDTSSGIARIIEALTVNGSGKSETISIRKAVEDYHADLTVRVEEGISGGYKTGFPSFDKYTGGFRPSQLVYLAGEPGVGKSIWASQVSLNISREIPSACYSIEMGKMLTTERMLASIGQLDQEHLQNGTLDEAEKKRYRNACKELSKRKLFINKADSWDLMALKADIMRRKAMDGVQFVILDYAYLMNESMKLDEIARSTIISRGLKMICNELNISMLAIQSVNKEGVGRDINGNRKRLSMANLRGSSQVLHDADLILIIQDYDDKIQKLTLPEAELENIKYITTQKSRTLKKKKLGIFVKHPDYPAFAEYIDEIGELS